MGLFTKKWEHLDDITPMHGLIGTNANWDSVLGGYDIEWDICTIEYAMSLIHGGIGEDRGYKIVNGIYYQLVYLPPPPHLQTYE